MKPVGRSAQWCGLVVPVVNFSEQVARNEESKSLFQLNTCIPYKYYKTELGLKGVSRNEIGLILGHILGHVILGNDSEQPFWWSLRPLLDD